MKILVTGSNGFIGKFLIEKLKGERLETISTDIKTDENTCYLDVLNLKNLKNFLQEKKPVVLIHLAAATGATGKGANEESIKNPFKYFKTNVLGTLNIFEACRICNIKKIIFVSSVTATATNDKPIQEDSPFNPATPYSFSKAAAEMIAISYSKLYGIKTIIFRLPIICGENQSELNALREFVDNARKGKPLLVYGDGSHVREWLHPIDVCEAIFKGLNYFNRFNNECEIFVLGGNPMTMKDLASTVLKKIGNCDIIYQNKGIPEISIYTNTKKAEEFLEWTPRISVEEIISRIIVSDEV